MKTHLDLKVNDEFYKMSYRKNKTFYKKCIVNKIELDNYNFQKIYYTIKGSSKNKIKIFKNVNVMAVVTKFFKTKDDLLFSFSEDYNFVEPDPQLKEEIRLFKIKKPQYFI
jgi:hypothetical protein